jgi:hypothetical protein
MYCALQSLTLKKLVIVYVRAIVGDVIAQTYIDALVQSAVVSIAYSQHDISTDKI